MALRLSIVACSLLLAWHTVYTSVSGGRGEAQSDVWVAQKIDALVAAARTAYEKDGALKSYQRVLDGIASAVQQRKLSHQGFADEYRNFVEYVEAASLDRHDDHLLGFVVPDKQYFEETAKYVEIPDYLLTQSFLHSVSRFETLDRAKAYLRELNATRAPADQLTFFSYKSRHLGTPDNDNSFRRLLIVVPGNPEAAVPERWVQFGVTDPGRKVRVRNVSIVSAMVRSDGTFDSYFKDSYRTYRRDGSITLKGRWELGFGDDNCARCHKSGVLPIFPEDGSVIPAEHQAVLEVNQRFRTYGSPRFDKYLDETRYGPGLGSASKASRTQRFGEGFAATTVARSMVCSGCHQPQGLGALNWPMDPVVIGSYVEGGQMPLGRSLKDSDRVELHRKLIQEYFATDPANPGILKAWLLGGQRATVSGGPPSPDSGGLPPRELGGWFRYSLQPEARSTREYPRGNSGDR